MQKLSAVCFEILNYSKSFRNNKFVLSVGISLFGQKKIRIEGKKGKKSRYANAMMKGILCSNHEFPIPIPNDEDILFTFIFYDD